MSSTEKNHSFKILAYRAVSEPELCEEYMLGHKKVLTDYGIQNITSNNRWIENKNMFCIIALNPNDNKMVGGIRIQVADGLFPLPVEDAIGKMDSGIYQRVKYYKEHGGVGELCGLWVSRDIKGVGMAPYLVRAAIASAINLNFQTMVGICAGYSLKMFNDVGFIIDNSLGEKGAFQYPDERYIAHVVGILNALTLETASAFDKERMIDLRKIPFQNKTEETNQIRSEILYNLNFKGL